MTAITPFQNVVYSALTQKAALSAGSDPVPASGNTEDAAPPVVQTSPSIALVQNVSSRLITTSGFYNASLGLAGINSKLDVAQAGTQRISDILQNLQNIARQIANGGNGSSVADLESQFQSLYAQIDQIVSTTSFGNSNLLDGSFTLDNNTFSPSQDAGSGSGASSLPVVPNLGTQSLFGSRLPATITPGNAAGVISAVAGAQDFVSGVNNNITGLGNQVNFAMASIETAQANSYAATSVINEGDIGTGMVPPFASVLSGKPGSAANTQTSKLSDNVLKLLS